MEKPSSGGYRFGKWNRGWNSPKKNRHLVTIIRGKCKMALGKAAVKQPEWGGARRSRDLIINSSR
jgi:hypothetical protein